MIIINERQKTLDISTLFSWFIIYSVIGWLYETTYCFVTSGRYLSRGFLYGPLCPIYGISIIMMLLFTYDRVKSIIGLFVSCALIASILEYVSSYWLELVFNRRWWNYSSMFLNINGRVCIGASILFGVCGVIIVRFLHPAMARFIRSNITSLQMKYINRSITIVLIIDILVSVRTNLL